MLRFDLTYRHDDNASPIALAADLPPGLHTLSGASGSGKSTVLLMLAGILRPGAGHITFAEQTLYDAAKGVFVAAHRRPVALVFQEPALFPHLRVWRNVAYGARVAGVARRREIAAQWLERMQASHLAERWPETLSGGEQERVALARAFAARPSVLLLDEPFASLDTALREHLVSVVNTEVERLGICALLVSHQGDALAGSAGQRLHMSAKP